MKSEPTRPADCRNMDEVREGIDAVDREIVALLGDRLCYMDAAARIKSDRATVRDEARKAEVLAHVRWLAREENIPADMVAALYEKLIEASIAYEYERFDTIQANAPAGE